MANEYETPQRKYQKQERFTRAQEEMIDSFIDEEIHNPIHYSRIEEMNSVIERELEKEKRAKGLK